MLDGGIFKKRNIFVQFLLFFVTGGLYFVYWLYHSSLELGEMNEDSNPDLFQNVAMSGFVFYFIIFFYQNFFVLKERMNLSFIYIPVFYGLFTITSGLYFMGFMYFYILEIMPFYILVVPIIVELGLIYYLYKYLRTCKDNQNVNFSLGLSLFLFILIRPFGIMYFQSSVNKSLISDINEVKSENSDVDRVEVKDEVNSDCLENQELSYNEQHAKKYIEDFKNSYSKDSIKIVLEGTGIDADEIDKYLDRYY